MTTGMQRLLLEKSIRWNARESHLACMAHVINLGVQDLLKSLKVVKKDRESEHDKRKGRNEENDDDEELEEREEEDEYDELAPFEATVSKIRTMAKVQSTRFKMTYKSLSPQLDRTFCTSFILNDVQIAISLAR